MKKVGKVLCVVMLLCSIFTVTGCTSANSKIVTEDEFKAEMEGKNANLLDLSEDGLGYEEVANKTEKAIIADGDGYQFIYAKMTDEAAANEYFSYMRDLFKEEHPKGNTTEGTINGNKEYSNTDGADFFKAVKKDTTVVVVVASSTTGIEESKAILKDFEY